VPSRSMTRETLHQLIDELPDADLPTAARVLEALHATGDLVRQALDHAPEDDEAETAEETTAVASAWQERQRGETLSTEEVRRRLGLS
ncbi:MAG TPA: hypothetical protein VFE33_25760, partial [Thermoanaerobaculia bacterium]|nr:hypothetical protein [Thermoanaerobaculia bacterium]